MRRCALGLVIALGGPFAQAGTEPGLALQDLAGTFERAVFLTHAGDDTGRHFIIEQRGSVRIHTGVQVLEPPFLDIEDWVTYGGERGLLGLAFDPDYDTNGWFYVSYTGTTPEGTGSSGDSRLVALQVDPEEPNLANRASATLLMSVSQPAGNHNGGWIGFGPDGYLYYALGDGGSADDPWSASGNGQDLSTQLGKMLRLEVNGNTAIAVPASNPFVGQGGVAPLIWSYGLRNPWRPSFDRMTGDLYIADVGQGLYEEVNFQPSSSMGGENYGWRVMEGLHCFDDNESGGNVPCFDSSLTDPVHEYSHDFGCSITGGYVYRGARIPELPGTYFLADYCTHRVWSFRYDTTDGKTDLMDRTSQLDPFANIFSFGEDELGELYVCTGTRIRRIVASPVNGGINLLDAYFNTDTNNDGVIDGTEAANAGLAQDAIGFLDANTDGSLTVAEVLAQTGPGHVHNADQNGDRRIVLSELLRVIQFFNLGGYRCAADPSASEDGFVPMMGDGKRDLTCYPHASDFLNPDGRIDLSEALRAIQLYNSDGYTYCPEADTEDGFCPDLT